MCFHPNHRIWSDSVATLLTFSNCWRLITGLSMSETTKHEVYFCNIFVLWSVKHTCTCAMFSLVVCNMHMRLTTVTLFYGDFTVSCANSTENVSCISYLIHSKVICWKHELLCLTKTALKGEQQNLLQQQRRETAEIANSTDNRPNSLPPQSWWQQGQRPLSWTVPYG